MWKRLQDLVSYKAQERAVSLRAEIARYSHSYGHLIQAIALETVGFQETFRLVLEHELKNVEALRIGFQVITTVTEFIKEGRKTNQRLSELALSRDACD
jgi:hypothetical protein